LSARGFAMAGSCVQLVLLARSSDIENWMQILVFVVLAVLYALGSIVKNKAARSTGTPGRPRKRPVRPPQQGTTAPMAERISRAAEQRAEQRVAGVVPPAAKAKAAVPGPKPAVPPAASVRPVPVEKHGAADHLEEVLEQQQTQQQLMPASYLAELAERQENLDELRKAVLYREILGRPVGLRPPGEEIIGL